MQDSNAYQIRAVARGEELLPQPGMPATVVLRGSGLSSALTMYVDTGHGWKPLRTFNDGRGSTFEAVSNTLGDFALFRPPGSSAGGGFPVAVIIGLLTAIIFAVTVALARFRLSDHAGATEK